MQITAVKNEISTESRSAETHYATEKRNVFLVVRTTHLKPHIVTRLARVVLDKGFYTETVTSLIHDRAPVASVRTHVSRYSAKQLREQHEQFINEHVTAENMPAMIEWAHRA